MLSMALEKPQVLNRKTKKAPGIVPEYLILLVFGYVHCFYGIYRLPVAPETQIEVTQWHVSSEQHMIGTTEVVGAH